jgi:hypothetical protein
MVLKLNFLITDNLVMVFQFNFLTITINQPFFALLKTTNFFIIIIVVI